MSDWLTLPGRLLDSYRRRTGALTPWTYPARPYGSLVATGVSLLQGLVGPLQLTGEGLAPAAAGALRWMKAATALSDERLSRLLGVSRQTLHAWGTGTGITSKNLTRLVAIRDVLQRAQQSCRSPQALSRWLDAGIGPGGSSPAQLIERGDVDHARLLAVTIRSAVSMTRPAAFRPAVVRPARPELDRSGPLPASHDEREPEWEDDEPGQDEPQGQR